MPVCMQHYVRSAKHCYMLLRSICILVRDYVRIQQNIILECVLRHHSYIRYNSQFTSRLYLWTSCVGEPDIPLAVQCATSN